MSTANKYVRVDALVRHACERRWMLSSLSGFKRSSEKGHVVSWKMDKSILDVSE